MGLLFFHFSSIGKFEEPQNKKPRMDMMGGVPMMSYPVMPGMPPPMMMPGAPPQMMSLHMQHG